MKEKSIKEIRVLIEKHSGKLDQKFILQLKDDPRKGVQKLYSQWCKRVEKEQKRLHTYKQMSSYENKCYTDGYRLIAGIDEVGRGPLAGPVVASAVILDRNVKIIGLDDSKKLSVQVREELYEKIIENAVAIGIGSVPAKEIDRINIYEASRVAMMKAIEDLPIYPDYLLIDAMSLPTDLPQEKIIKGDAQSNSIAAASIVAKVTRDRMMLELDRKYPQYFFHSNVGYATADHLDALKEYGITPEHRKSFAPVSQLLPNN
ncbi:ribonuclease HII [Pseudalkalibacillus salsuginis]|uniref:ribonuclease HII n=1 Tax=Pseudalkalibacillus salsuginis TaxID=2910972 RepID=UPI001F201D97|nr:ribonuclease HII [Pseudalkalibacillus salsuginis]MCF6410548.1 ribonuclease HII [Pseudalkalibacillus salsuginis]